jgi:hypothetical protein
LRRTAHGRADAVLDRAGVLRRKGRWANAEEFHIGQEVLLAEEADPLGVDDLGQRMPRP